jgi:hypothetical protein
MDFTEPPRGSFLVLTAAAGAIEKAGGTSWSPPPVRAALAELGRDYPSLPCRARSAATS